MRRPAPALLKSPLVTGSWDNDASYGGVFKVLNILHRVLNTLQKVRHKSRRRPQSRRRCEKAPKSVALRGCLTDG
jgi:hypothetical protein